MTAAIVLAAGAATRMGRLKQLLPYRGETLLGHAVQQVIAAGFEIIIVVIGAQSEAVCHATSSKPVHIVENANWQAGMGSSITAGMRWLQERSDASTPDSIAILLGDQPLVEAQHLKSMRERLACSDAVAVAAEYNGTVGVPAMFKPGLFDQLANLAPEAGARQLLRNPRYKILPFPLPEAAVDLDTPEDLAALPHFFGGGGGEDG